MSQRIKIALPVHLSILVAENKIYREYQLFLYLKYLSDSNIILCKGRMNVLGWLMNVTESTIGKYLKNLLSRNWIGYNYKTNLYIVRGYKEVMEIEGIKGYLTMVTCLSEVSNIRALIGASIFGWFYRNSKYKIHKKRWNNKEGRGYGRIKRERPKQYSHPSYYPVSIYGVSKMIHVSLSEICRLKKQAIEYGLIAAEHNIILIKAPKGELAQVRKYGAVNRGKYILIGNNIYLSLPDLIKPLVTLRRCHRLK